MIIAIGGGEIVSNETYEIDKFIVESAKILTFYLYLQQVKMLRLI